MTGSCVLLTSLCFNILVVDLMSISSMCLQSGPEKKPFRLHPTRMATGWLLVIQAEPHRQ